MLILLPNAVSYGMLIEPEGDASQTRRGLGTALSRAKTPRAHAELFA
jgi:hypothetical protein